VASHDVLRLWLFVTVAVMFLTMVIMSMVIWRTISVDMATTFVDVPLYAPVEGVPGEIAFTAECTGKRDSIKTLSFMASSVCPGLPVFGANLTAHLICSHAAPLLVLGAERPDVNKAPVVAAPPPSPAPNTEAAAASRGNRLRH